jgi:hypothetical protein
MEYWHYTTRNRFDNIVKSKRINPSKEYNAHPTLKGGKPLNIKPAVYLSTEPVFEYACLKPSVVNGMQYMMSVDKFTQKHGVIRIKVNPLLNKILTWNKLYKAQGIPKIDNLKLVNGAIECKSNPSKHWFGVIGAITLDEIEAYEFDGVSSWRLLEL